MNYNSVNTIHDFEALLQRSQFEALKSLSKLLSREIDLLKDQQRSLKPIIASDKPINLAQEVQNLEIHLIKCALIRSMGRQNKAAQLLGMKITTLCEKMKRYHIDLNS